MSDSHIYELEDIVWDDFSISDDHLTHPETRQNEGSTFQAESHKKLKHEVRMTSSTGHYVVAAGKTSLSSPNIKGEQVLAKGSWSCNPDPFQLYEEPMPCLSSGGPTVASGHFMPNSNIFTVNSTPANNCNTAGESGSYSLSDVHQSESSLRFLSHGHENKESDDSLFYEWPEIGNFEDVDQFLGKCDSTFEPGDLGNDDGMCWLSSSTTINGLDAASKAEAMSSKSNPDSLMILLDNSEPPHHRNYKSTAVDVFNKRSADASYTSFASNTREQSCLSKAASVIKTPANLNNGDKEKPVKKISCSKNSGMDEKPIEETSFHQLQEVMQQLDLNTKLRIRDSLYRLAHSAEQKHGNAMMCNKANKHSSEVLIAESKYCVKKLHPHYSISLGCAGLLDIEADTNPTDRTIAHLLFHRPNDHSKKSPTGSPIPE